MIVGLAELANLQTDCFLEFLDYLQFIAALRPEEKEMRYIDLVNNSL